MEKKFIGFDLGAESGRCVVAKLKENKISLHEVHRFTTHSINYENGFYWDILAIYEEIIEGLIKARKAFDKKFDGIGIDTWGVDYVLIDSENRILGYPHHYRDNRTDESMQQAFQIVPQKQIYKKTGIQFAQFNTLFQLISENKQKLNLLNVADKILLIPDFLNFLLSGKKKAEFSIASTTSLTNPNKRNWLWELIDSFGLPRRIFPEMVEPGTILGTLLPSIAERTGLEKNIPVIAIAGHDTASAVVSVPACKNNWAFLSSGTWSLMGIELEQPILSSQAMKYNFTNEGGVENTTRFLKNIIGLWPIQECRRYWQNKTKEYSYPELVSMAKENGFAKAWIDLNDPRFLKAGEMPEKIVAFLQETGQTSKPEIGFIIRVVLESLAFSYRNTIKEIEKVSGNKIKILHAVGGGIQNELLTQLTADAIGLNVLAGPIEGTIIGNIGVQSIASGSVPDIHVWRKIVANSFELKIYKPKGSSYFDENEQNYNNILK
jgi:sugar (pentulose or hexulose) kinase